MYRHLTKIIGLIFLFGSIALTAQAQELKTQSFTLPGHGQLTLKFPATWDSKVEQSGNNPPTIGFKPKTDNNFNVLLTPGWPIDPSKDVSSPDKVRDLVEKVGAASLPQAVEKKLTIKEFGADGKTGYYFAPLTDKAPNPGEFKYMSQGMIKEGNLILIFTLLTNSKETKELDTVLNVIANAKQKL
jgi:hypothetical protein